MSETPAASQPPAGDPMAQPPVEQPAKSGGAGKKILGIVGALVVIAVIAVVKFGAGEVWSLITGDISTAKAGDCVNDFQDVNDAKVVECGKPEAKYKVDGIVEDVTESEFDTKQQTLCDAFPNWETVVWTGRAGGNGDAWCLTPIS